MCAAVGVPVCHFVRDFYGLLVRLEILDHGSDQLAELAGPVRPLLIGSANGPESRATLKWSI
jgi:hypothetical protein